MPCMLQVEKLGYNWTALDLRAHVEKRKAKEARERVRPTSGISCRSLEDACAAALGCCTPFERYGAACT